MKKFLITNLLALIALTGYSQLNGGIKAGVNISNFIGKDASGSDPRIGYNAGGYLTIGITDLISFQPELLVNSVGARSSESGVDQFLGNYKVDATIQLTYIILPAMFLLNLNDQISLQAGPQIGVMVAGKAKYDIKSDFITTSGSDDVKSQFKPIDFGVNLGVGATFGLINASVRYTLGLANIPDDNSKVKNSVIQFSLGYRIKK